MHRAYERTPKMISLTRLAQQGERFRSKIYVSGPEPSVWNCAP
jgi:hypothetical protein